jgi:hypothetical protein
LNVKTLWLTAVPSDSNITFEEYAYYAVLTRAEEKQTRDLDLRASRKGRFAVLSFIMFESKEDGQPTGVAPLTSTPTVTDEEWAQVARATRNATWGAVFFLITTDLFGPMSVPSDTLNCTVDHYNC